jgi:hypothetical protein
MNDLTQYYAARATLRAGDIIGFYGTALISWAIRLFAPGPSHCGFVRQPMMGGKDVLMCESTIENGNSGVQTNALGNEIANYGAPLDAAVLYLSDETRKRIDWFKFYQIIGSAEDHTKYDTIGLIEYLERDIPILGPRIAQGQHKNKYVCSAWNAAVMEYCGVTAGVDWSQATPQQIVEMGIYRGWSPLCGKPTLTRFNTV